MKLYLSSYGVGNHPEKLQALVGDNKTAGIILNAQDLADEQKRSDRVDMAFKQMSDLGFEPEELDLRQYFRESEKLEDRLAKFGLLWIVGGNVFVLQRAMRMSGFYQIIHTFVASERLVYAGYSAGSCAAGLGLHGIELCDDNNMVPDGYRSDVIWEGLNLFPYAIAPHYQSDHHESADIDNVVAYFEKHSIAYKALRDGQAIVISGQNEELVG